MEDLDNIEQKDVVLGIIDYVSQCFIFLSDSRK